MKNSFIPLFLISISALAQQDLSVLERIRGDYADSRTNKVVYAYITDEMRIQYFDQICASNTVLVNAGVTNSVLLHCPEAMAMLNSVARKMNAAPKAEFIAEWDTRFAEAGFCWLDHKTFYLYPKLMQNYFNQHPEYVEKHPVAFTLFNRHPTTNLTLPEEINKFYEQFSLGELANKDVSGRVKQYASKLIVPVKKYLRTKGKTFVVGENDQNPVQDFIDQFISSTEAPKCAGLKEWVLELYPDYQWVDATVMSDSDVTALKDSVFYGETPLDKVSETTLRFYLGVDAYNAFINEYNSDSTEAN